MLTQEKTNAILVAKYLGLQPNAPCSPMQYSKLSKQGHKSVWSGAICHSITAHYCVDFLHANNWFNFIK